MVSNDEIKRKLAKKKNPSTQNINVDVENLNVDRAVSSEELKEKFRKQRKLKSENSGYLVCDNCGGYYELQAGESPDDFTEKCQCGGKLKHAKTINGSR